ncbi:citrate lyase subunit beta/citryl-CoA lyase [Microbacterium resistens]|uniref:Citrate lyase subunit beta/citryl-CoA lyase n=1 Tax=Microbacterium resistens TaxID=156977 RepID=A0ABU1SGX8_9MICO|nr:CoA ester lyase [Microbacterium resistens]MDR6868117.1 citrate lyase subunit beta/citryl-CoA lyase [Microbacterium resistens]
MSDPSLHPASPSRSGPRPRPAPSTAPDLFRTGLYVPGDRPDRFAKAAASGAELVVLDLEDAVAPERKAQAREEVIAWLATRTGDGDPAFQVRVNAGDDDDLRAVATLPTRIGVRLPKVDAVSTVAAAALLAPGRSLVALLENARGVLRAAEIAAHPAVSALALGESDLRSELGGGDPVLDHARLSALFAARAAGLPAPMASVYPAFRDIDGLLADTRRAASLGLYGRMAAHPTQLAPIAAVFRPSVAEVAWAHAVEAALASGGVQTLPDGEMVDPAMAGRARAILRHASAT